MAVLTDEVNMELPKLLAFPDKYFPAFDGSNQQDVKMQPLSGFMHAMEDAHQSDAHFVCYTLPALSEAADKGLRVKKDALVPLVEQGDGYEPQLNYAAIDVDLPGHREWTDADRAEFVETVRTQPLLQQAGIYFSQHGWRAIWPLEVPIPARYADSYLSQFIAHVRDLGIPADEQCKDWTRMFRLPNVRRESDDGAYRSTAEVSDFTSMRPLTWAPDERDDALAKMSSSPMPTSDGSTGEGDHWGYGPASHPWVEDALAAIDADITYEEWVRVGMALKHEWGNDAFYLWDQWSSTGTKYEGTDACRTKWDSFSGTRYGKPVTLRTLAFKAKQAGFRMPLGEDQKLVADEMADTLNMPAQEAAHALVAFVASSNHFYVWDESNSSYTPPYKSDGLLWAINNLCPTLADGRHVNEKGNLHQTKNLLDAIGTPVHEVQLVMGQEGNYYEPSSQAMLEGVGSIQADVVPEHDPEIDQWLRLIGGPKADELLDWLAVYPRFGDPVCALYLHGPPSIGKGMLAEGIAVGMHGRAPTPYSALTESFQEEIANCPLILADEAIPTGFYGDNASSIFRRIIGTTQMSLNRKYKPHATLIGAPRLLITANNDDALKMREDLTENDREAIKRRIGYIKTDAKAAAYLESLGGRAHTEAWVDGGGIARHIMWLAENRQVTAGDRFLVEGWDSELIRTFNFKTGINQELLIALVSYIDSGTRSDMMPYGDGEFLVHMKTLHNKWKTLTNSFKVPTQSQLSNALDSISPAGTKRPRVNDKRPTCYIIDLDAIFYAADHFNLADRNELEAKINTPSERIIDGEQPRADSIFKGIQQKG